MHVGVSLQLDGISGTNRHVVDVVRAREYPRGGDDCQVGGRHSVNPKVSAQEFRY